MPTNQSIEESVCLDFTTCAGEVRARVAGDHDEVLDIREYMTWLRIRGSSGIGKLVRCRNEQDLPDSPIGLYSACLEIAMLDRIRDVVESTPWTALPRPTRSHFTDARLAIRYRRGDRLIERDFWTSSGAFIAAIEPVMQCIRDCMRTVRRAPAAVLAVSARIEQEPMADTVRCVLRLSNVGRETLGFRDPRVIAPDSEMPLLAVAVAPDDPMACPDWMPLELPPLGPGEPEVVELHPGASHELSLPWQAQQPGAHLLVARWEDYRGLERAAEPSSFMPLPDDAASTTPNVRYLLLGATTSCPVRFEVPSHAP